MATKKETEESKIKASVKKTAKATLGSLKEAVEKATKAVAKAKTAKAANAVKATKAAEKNETTKEAVKATPKAASKSTVKAATKTATKAVTKTAAKTIAKIAEKTSTKTATKAISKVATKAAETKATTAKVAAKTAIKTATKPTVKKAPSKVQAKEDDSIVSMAQSFDAEYLVLMQKDPNWMHAFWEVSEKRMENAKKGKGKIVLRLFDISSDLTVKRNKKFKFHDIEVPADARSWYIENNAGKAVVAVLGSVKGNDFMPLVESMPVALFDKSAAAPALDDNFAKASLGGNTLGNFMSSGFSSQTAESWLNALGNNFGSSSESMFSGALSSSALQSSDIQVSKDSVNYGKDFFLWVKTRLIVYGGTRPDAHLQVRGEPFPLNPDGTFSFEEDLPDCTKVIPVFATDKDGDFPTTIVPIVVKRTE